MTESVFTKFPPPPCAKLLGWELIAEHPDEGRIEIAFHPTAQMTNSKGSVQGGIVAAMLDDTMGPALITMTGGTEFPSSIDINVSFVKPVMPGRVIGKGKVVSRGRSVAFLEAELFDENGMLLARSTSSVRIIAFG